MREKREDAHKKQKNTSSINDITTTHKRELEVILIYPEKIGRNEGIPYAHHIISHKLKELGIKHRIYNDSDPGLKLSIQLDVGSFRIFARSACYEHIPTVIKRNTKIYPDVQENSFTVVGGQASIDRNARSYMLESGIDAINVKHAQPFFDFLHKLRSSETIDRDVAFNSARDILAIKEQQEVSEGKFPDLNRFPLVACRLKGDAENDQDPSKDYIDHVIIPPHENCPNHCDFCSLIKIETNTVGQLIANLITEAKKPIPKMVFEGPTFDGKSLQSFKKILHAAKEVQGYTPESNIIMDSNQFQEKYYEKMLQQLKECNVKQIRLGLDAIDGESAASVGRRDHGKIRTDEQIQEEKAGILKFLKEEDIETFGIDMLLTPFDTPAIIEKILSFFKEVLMISKERNIDAHMYLLPLIPYPETPLYERYKDYVDIKNYSQLAGISKQDLSVWKFDEETFGLKCQHHYLLGFRKMLKLSQRDAHKVAYLNFLALSMSYQYLQGTKRFEDMDILYSEYRNDKQVKAIFRAICEKKEKL